jgi:hypothetical protein
VIPSPLEVLLLYYCRSQSISAPQKRQHTFSEYCSPSSMVMTISSSVADSPLVPSGCPLKKTFALIEPLLTSATGVVFGLLMDFLGLLFFFCALEDRLGAVWSSTGGWSDIMLMHACRKARWDRLTCALQCLLGYASDVQPLAATGTRALHCQFVGVLRRFVDTDLSKIL